MKKIFTVFLLFVFHLTSFTHASTSPSGDGKWGSKTVTRVGLDDIIEATARKQVVKNGSSVTLEAVVRETVRREAVGKVLLSRILGGGIAVGGITALIGAIGWVMEGGQYVKYLDPKDDEDMPDAQFYWITNYSITKSRTHTESASKFVVRTCELNNYYSCSTPYNFTVSTSDQFGPSTYRFNYDVFNSSGSKTVRSQIVARHTNLKYDPEAKPKKIVLTDQLVGDIAVGDYTDPVDSSKDKKDRKWTDVENAYKDDPNGIGNELSDALDGKMDNAPETPTKPDTPPQTDGEGQKYPTDQDKGTDGKTDQEVDPVTGQPTGQGSFTLPAWCLWAADNCEWHKEDKAHQTQEKTVWEYEKKHRTDEKTFWQKVTDFFDWVKEKPETEEEQEQPEIDDKGIFSKTFDHVFSLSSQCPPDIPWKLESQYLSGNFTFSMKWLCIIFTALGYPIVFASHCIGVWILYEATVRKEMKW
ncbi:MAG: hypothetical protein KAZ18_06420 [Acinetobacter sp.]|nr:hypothetical protein [Acinetobacter sp.]